jgi:hypothetical protein
MRILLALISFGLVVATATPVEAAVGRKSAAKPKATKAAAKKKSGELSTNHDFEDQTVRGEYQMPDEALVKVENEKLLGDLLGVRKHFKDRLEEASEQE